VSVVEGDELPVHLDVAGAAAPPRLNGELVFTEPWESRVFGVTMALHQSGAFVWDEFKDQLIAAIGGWEAAHPDGQDYRYYRCWLDALQHLLADRRIVTTGDLDHRLDAFAQRPADHDHDHDHDHDR